MYKIATVTRAVHCVIKSTFYFLQGIEDLKEEFVASLGLPFGNAPLIIFLDSLDQLDPANGARGVSWLPTEFSENVKIVVSTLVDRQYEAFPKLKV